MRRLQAFAISICCVGVVTLFTIAEASAAAKACELPNAPICHSPPGNPNNVKEICVSVNSAVAHQLNHGDFSPILFYPDVDGDGFGAGDAETGCSIPLGFVENTDDCNDGDPETNPDADEIPGDGIDNDCNADTPDEPPIVCPCEDIWSSHAVLWREAAGVPEPASMFASVLCANESIQPTFIQIASLATNTDANDFELITVRGTVSEPGAEDWFCQSRVNLYSTSDEIPSFSETVREPLYSLEEFEACVAYQTDLCP